jgi:hypothetical protein
MSPKWQFVFGQTRRCTQYSPNSYRQTSDAKRPRNPAGRFSPHHSPAYQRVVEPLRRRKGQTNLRRVRAAKMIRRTGSRRERNVVPHDVTEMVTLGKQLASPLECRQLATTYDAGAQEKSPAGSTGGAFATVEQQSAISLRSTDCSVSLLPEAGSRSAFRTHRHQSDKAFRPPV